jgi:hypothetical protein
MNRRSTFINTGAKKAGVARPTRKIRTKSVQNPTTCTNVISLLASCQPLTTFTP